MFLCLLLEFLTLSYIPLINRYNMIKVFLWEFSTQCDSVKQKVLVTKNFFCLSSLKAFVFIVLFKNTSFEISFIYHAINPFKVYSLINFNIFRVMQLIYNQFWDIFITLKRNPVAISNAFALYAWMLVSRFHKTDNFFFFFLWFFFFFFDFF